MLSTFWCRAAHCNPVFPVQSLFVLHRKLPNSFCIEGWHDSTVDAVTTVASRKMQPYKQDENVWQSQVETEDFVSCHLSILRFGPAFASWWPWTQMEASRCGRSPIAGWAQHSVTFPSFPKLTSRHRWWWFVSLTSGKVGHQIWGKSAAFYFLQDLILITHSSVLRKTIPT